VEIGQEPADFELRDQHGQCVRLSSFRGTSAVVVMFYPHAFSRVCTTELRDARDTLPRFESAEAQLLAISCDPMFTLRAVAEADALRFPLLSHFWPHGQVASAFGAFDENSGRADRATFVLDRDGTLRWSGHSAAPVARDFGEVLGVLEGLAAPRRGHRPDE